VSGWSHASVPVFTLDADGAVEPNPLFHRPYDKLHSRCIEYPFAASRVPHAGRILDVGTAKADRAWIAWLDQLPATVHGTDYDAPTVPMGGIHFHRADLRALPLKSEVFDTVIAVSVVEHVGLEAPQVESGAPARGDDGDVEAVAELVRVMKPAGRLILTVPFHAGENHIDSRVARSYDRRSLRRFEAVAALELFEYYEYQHSDMEALYQEFAAPAPTPRGLSRLLRPRSPRPPAPTGPIVSSPPPGAVTWRRVPPEHARAVHRGHVEGVACTVWRRQ
jgi:SAM-dependent methyltransferase